MPTKPQKYVNLYTEASPNPNSLKFVANYMLVPENQDFDFADAEAAKTSPLAEALFAQFPFAQRVFLMNNFVTITKDEETDWYEVAGGVKQFIKEYLEADKPILSENALGQGEAEFDEQDKEIVGQIQTILDEYIKPAVESDGGAINLAGYHDKKVKLELRGSCSGCPASTATLKGGIENVLKRMLPNHVDEVIAEGV